MAFGFTELAETPDTTNGTAYSSASFTPTANSLMIMCALAAAYDEALPITVAGHGVTWNLVDSWTRGSAAMWVYYAIASGSPSADTVDITLDASDPSTGAIIAVYEFTGYDTTTPIVQAEHNSGGTAGTTPSASFLSATQSDSAVLCVAGTTLNPPGMTPPTGYTETTDNGFSTPTFGMQVCYHLSPGSVTTVTYGATNANVWSLGLVEIGLAAGATLTRAVAAAATATVTVSNYSFWTIFERSVAAAATATATVANSIRHLLRSTAASATATVAVSGFLRHLLRQVAATAASGIATAGNFWTVFERAVAASAATAISSAGVIIVLIERAVSVTATATVTVANSLRHLLRQTATSATGLTAVSGFKTAIRSVAASAATSITVAGARTLMRAVAAAAVTAVSTASIRHHLRQVAASATGATAVSFIRSLLRQVAATATSAINTVGSFTPLQQPQLPRIRKFQRRNR